LHEGPVPLDTLDGLLPQVTEAAMLDASACGLCSGAALVLVGQEMVEQGFQVVLGIGDVLPLRRKEVSDLLLVRFLKEQSAATRSS
jgi:hypothetical protein